VHLTAAIQSFAWLNALLLKGLINSVVSIKFWPHPFPLLVGVLAEVSMKAAIPAKVFGFYSAV
jgi:hypothetical protein